MISVDEALERILGSVSPLGLERVSVLDALGRVVGEDVYSGRDIPPCANSAMDGYALRASDTKGAGPESPVRLLVVDEIPAGSLPKAAIGPGQAARIMTGAPLPEGADAVVRVEDTRREDPTVAILAEARPGQDIRQAGEDVSRGEKVVGRGEVVRPATVGMLASLGRSFVLVHQRPQVAIVATGDELVEIDETPPPGKIVSSNTYSLAAQVKDCGGLPIIVGIARDNRRDLVEKFQAARRADLVISSGGVSVGDYDLVKDIMQEVGNSMQFWRVAMRPGRPLAFGMLDDVPLVGLPGNPVSAMVSFEQFVRPALLKMQGHGRLFRRTVEATLAERVKKKAGLRYFLRGTASRGPEGYSVATTGEQGSGILKSMVRANCLIVLGEEATLLGPGEKVSVQLLDEGL